VGGISTTYLACNNGKRSITANLKDPADRERIWELIAGADVINQNFRPGVLERLGFGFEDVAKVRPDIVYASTSGYGWDGPFAGEPCTDPHAQAFGGFAALNGEPGGPPYKIRYIGFIDVVTSTVIAEGICAALLLRDRQGGAVHMQTSMMHAVLESTRPAGPRLAPDGLFRCADGWVAVTCRDEAEWTRLVEVTGAAERLGRPEFAANEERVRSRAALRIALDEVLGERAAHAWVLALTRAGIPCSRLIHDDEILIRRDYREHGFVTELLHGDRPPLAGGGEPVAMAGAVALRAPLPAEHDARFREAPGDFWLTPKARASADENFETTANSEGATHEL
jgi:crotonobetainyl-CoA:carnitine CoA-transferase CaiB-like acyl-CoA transferase